MSKDEEIEKTKKYFEWLDKLYPLKTFKIYGKDDNDGNVSVLTFHHRWNHPQDDNATTELEFYSATEEELKYYDIYREYSLKGEEVPKEFVPPSRYKSYIGIDTEAKTFTFIIADAESRHGYGEYLYYNAQSILERLGIDDREKYKVSVNDNFNHDLFKHLETKRLIDLTNTSPNKENGIYVMRELSGYPYAMSLRNYNTLIQYAIDSKVPKHFIVDAINWNEFNVRDALSFRRDEKEVNRFKSFGINGISLTRMHKHFTDGKNDLKLMNFFGELDSEEASKEFRALLDYIEKDLKARQDENKRIETENENIRRQNAIIEEENSHRMPGEKKKNISYTKTKIYISPILEQYGSLASFLVEWKYPELLVKYIDPSLKSIVRRTALKMFELADPEHKDEWRFSGDSTSRKLLEILKEAGMMNPNTYIALYQKALNRNYSLEEFRNVASSYIDYDNEQQALEEISQHTYYPAPKKDWQRSHSWDPKAKIQRIEIPQSIAKKYGRDARRIRDAVKKQILSQKEVQDIKIKTDMTIKNKNGVYTNVDRLVDWMFGVNGKRGYMQMKGNVAFTFPPQTPDYPLELVRGAFRRMEDPDYGVRE